jgi:hypothetical protein
MTAKIPGVAVPAGATIDIHIHVTAPVNITPFVARQKVNAFVKMQVSTQLRAEEPDLIVGERLCWSAECGPCVQTDRSPPGMLKAGELKEQPVRMTHGQADVRPAETADAPTRDCGPERQLRGAVHH